MKIIKREFSDIKIFAKTIEESALKQIKELGEFEAYKKNKIRIMPDCLTQDAEVLTENGFIEIVNLSPNVKIANYDYDTKNIFYKKPKQIISRDKKENEKIYQYSNKQQGITMTMSHNHRLCIKNNKEIIAGDKESILLKEQIFNANKRISTIDRYSDDFIRIICWVVGDGSIKKTFNAKSVTKNIRFGLKKERKIKQIIKLCKNLNLGFSRYDSKKQTTISINTKSSRELIRIVGDDKNYPKDFEKLNKRQSIILLEELIKVDGDYEAYINNRGYRLNSSRERDCDFFQIVISQNYGVSKKVLREVYSNYTKEKRKLYYVTAISEDKLSYSKGGIHNRKLIRTEIDYKGKLVCVECDSSYFVCRQNGVTFITGNCHAGAGCTIGTTMEIKDKITPNLVGTDIGCGMLTVKLKETEIDLKKFDEVINKYIPNGFNVHNKPKVDFDFSNLIANGVNIDRAKKSIGTLGGGNHFIEIDKNARGELYLVIHSGSRQAGFQVAGYYQKVAAKSMKYSRIAGQLIIKKLKKEGRQKDISVEIKKLKKPVINKDLAYLVGNEFHYYMVDMVLIQKYAVLNRRTMANIILEKAGLTEEHSFETIHNYVDFDDMILRKGAVSAKKSELLLIPINMKDGSIIAKGKGNPDWNYSAPHGAGRLMSRKQAHKKLSLEEFKEQMKGIYTTSVSSKTLDEAPNAYKPMSEIVNTIKDTVEILEIIKPIYNFKAN